MKKEQEDKYGRSVKVIYQLGRWRVVSVTIFKYASGDETVEYMLEYMEPDALGAESWRISGIIKVPVYNTGPTLESFLWEMFYDMDRGTT